MGDSQEKIQCCSINPRWVPQPSTELGNFLCLSAHGAAEAPGSGTSEQSLSMGMTSCTPCMYVLSSSSRKFCRSVDTVICDRDEGGSVTTPGDCETRNQILHHATVAPGNLSNGGHGEGCYILLESSGERPKR